ncbi:hypothetical protein SKAU_G00252140 [Synaphobranchus kaupii]|uniref:Uncharacterized protein n=1 Tax=Synaphobranchus kaupii TaxID=118154 RepID=A0A9Q1F322_SYNKA|nr:hypothetical protein SKAU_G00252140 [Synaphobranchus kaupii]
MDILTAQRLVEGAEDSLRKCVRDFEGVKRAADEFVVWANGMLQENDDCEVVVQTALPQKRWERLKKCPLEGYTVRAASEMPQGDKEDREPERRSARSFPLRGLFASAVSVYPVCD